MRFWYAENGHRRALCVFVFLQSKQTSLTFDDLVFQLVTRAPLLQFRQVPQTMSSIRLARFRASLRCLLSSIT